MDLYLDPQKYVKYWPLWLGFMGLGLLFYILLGFRYTQGLGSSLSSDKPKSNNGHVLLPTYFSHR